MHIPPIIILLKELFTKYKSDIKRMQGTNLDWFGKHLNASVNVKNYIKSMWGREEEEVP
jgi:hypothetical protein